MQDLPGRNRDDTQSVQNRIENGLNIDGVEITEAIRLGERGQNKGIKPSLILATLDTPVRKRVILAASKNLRNTENWASVCICPDPTPMERERERGGKNTGGTAEKRRDEG